MQVNRFKLHFVTQLSLKIVAFNITDNICANHYTMEPEDSTLQIIYAVYFHLLEVQKGNVGGKGIYKGIYKWQTQAWLS